VASVHIVPPEHSLSEQQVSWQRPSTHAAERQLESALQAAPLAPDPGLVRPTSCTGTHAPNPPGVGKHTEPGSGQSALLQHPREHTLPTLEPTSAWSDAQNPDPHCASDVHEVPEVEASPASEPPPLAPASVSASALLPPEGHPPEPPTLLPPVPVWPPVPGSSASVSWRQDVSPTPASSPTTAQRMTSA